MKTLRTHYRLLIFMILSLLVTCIIAPWMALAADWIHLQWPRLLSERAPFDKVFNRAFMVASIVLFVTFRHILIPPELKSLLAPGYSIASRHFLLGLCLALASMVLLAAVMVAADVFRPYFRLPWEKALPRLASAAAAGVFAGFLEEIFFRGILFFGLRAHGNAGSAYIFTNLFYSLIHFIKPGEDYYIDRFDVFAGFRHLATTFEAFRDPLMIVPGIIGLFLIGIVLSFALDRSGNLYLSIGLHTGWIFSLQSLRVFGNFHRRHLGWEFGASDPKIVSGVATWFGVLLVGFAISGLTRKRAR
jgi:membrane protease YdiL (CAAX protease family)